MDASRLFLDGADREAVGAVVVVQRVHVRRVEVQVTTVVRRVRNRRPIVAVAADVVRRPRRVVAIPRSRKESNRLLNVAEDSLNGAKPRRRLVFHNRRQRNATSSGSAASVFTSPVGY